MEPKLFFSTDKYFNSISNLRTHRPKISPDKASIKHDQTNSRKNLPQTSNLLLGKRKGTKEFPPSSPSNQITSANPDYENLIMLNKARDKLSKDLLKLISQIWAVYGNCAIFPDAGSSDCSFYEYLFDPGYSKILSVDDLKLKPEFLIISTRQYIIEPSTSIFNQSKISLQESKSVTYINLYSSIIPNHHPHINLSKKFHKSPVYKLKSIEPRSKYSKSPLPAREVSYESSEFRAHIFPHSKGGRVKEGAGGFRKPVLLFEKSKNSSPIPEKQESFIPSSSLYKDYPEIDETCLKYSLTHQEFLTILSDFTYLKENQLNYMNQIKESYSVKSEVLLAINPNLESETVNWEDFIKFYVIVVLRRGGFLDLLMFLGNFLTVQGRIEDFLWVSRVFGKNYHLVEKVIKVKAALMRAKEKEVGKGELLTCVQGVGMNIFDLRLIVTLIIRNF